MLATMQLSVHRLARTIMFAGIAVTLLPFGLLVGLGKVIKLVTALKDTI